VRLAATLAHIDRVYSASLGKITVSPGIPASVRMTVELCLAPLVDAGFDVHVELPAVLPHLGLDVRYNCPGRTGVVRLRADATPEEQAAIVARVLDRG
jgi:hypothetical protein